MIFDRILVPLDRSALAECALPHTVALGHALGSQVALLHVVALPARVDRMQAVDPLDWQIRKTEADTYLRGAGERLRQVALPVETHVVEGDAAEQIVDFAREHDIQLIVVSSHGQSGLSGWNVSSVVQKVILRAYTSIMIVRAYECTETDLAGLRYRRLLVALDGSQRAECVLPAAAGLARAHAAQIVLAHVVHRPEMPRRTPLSREDGELAERIVERNREEAERYLADVRSRLPPEVDVEERLLVSERVVGTLHELVEQEDIDMVLLSAHGYSAETRYPYGSVVISFVAYGTTPLLIVQDVPPERVVPTRAELAAQESGRR